MTSAVEQAERIADEQGVYGVGDPWGDHPDNCNCRTCFVIRKADEIENCNYGVFVLDY